MSESQQFPWSAVPLAGRICRLTAPGISALATVRVEGERAASFVRVRLGKVPGVGALAYGQWTIAGAVLDDPLVCGVRDDCFDVNLHGGRRIVEKFLEDATASGFVDAAYEPADDVERWLPFATTSAGLRLLLAQRDFDLKDADRNDRTLERLLVPARVAIVGPANAGKSTLVNRLAGRSASLVADIPGTTRDYVEASANLCDGQLPIVLLDTPGRRADAGEIEAAAIEVSEAAVASADLVILLLDATRPTNMPPGLESALKVWNKADVGQPPGEGPAIVATTGAGIAELEAAIAHALGTDLAAPPRACPLPTLPDTLRPTPDAAG